MDLGKAMVDQSHLSSSSWSLQGQLGTWRTRYAQRGDKRADVLGLVVNRMRMKAASFPEALKDIAPPMDIMALVAAEQEGSLGEGLVALANDVAAADQMRKTVKKHLYQPAFLAFMAIVILCGFSYGLIPVLVQTIPADKLPITGYILYVISKFVTGFGPVLAGILIAGSAWVYWSFDNFIGRSRDKMENWPFYSMYRDYNSARFMQSLARLMHANVTLRNSLLQLSTNATPWLKSHVVRIVHRLDNGQLPEDAFATGLLDIEIEDRMRDYTTRSDFPKAIQDLGRETSSLVLEKIVNSAALIEALCKLFMAVLICFTVAALIHSAVESGNAMQSSFTKPKK